MKKITLLGTGKPIREFIHSDDLASAIINCLKVPKNKFKRKFKNEMPIINVGTGESISILNLAKLIGKLVDFKGNIIFDKSFPDGTFRKDLNSKKIKELGWKPKIKLADGLKQVIKYRFI